MQEQDSQFAGDDFSGADNPMITPAADAYSSASVQNGDITTSMRPETAEFLNNLAGIGTGAFLAMRQADTPEYEDWRDENFAPEGEGSYVSGEDQGYTEEELEQMHGLLSRQAGNPLVSGLFAGPQSRLADYLAWRNQNYLNENEEGGGWEDEEGNLYTEPALQEMFGAKFQKKPDMLLGQSLNAAAGQDQPQPSTQDATPQSASEPPVINATAQVKARSKIPQQPSDGSTAPPLIKLTPKEQRSQLNSLMAGVRSTGNTPYGVMPDGTEILDLRPQVKAPSRISRQYESGDYFSNINTALIKSNEGGTRLDGYVPDSGKSGVTIAAGFDIGQHSLADLRQLGFPKDLTDRLEPYVLLQRDDAKTALKKTPLNISAPEAMLINQAALNNNLNEAASAFNKAKAKLAGSQATETQDRDPQGHPAEFAKLPWQAQTVIADLWYNMGHLDGPKVAPDFWRQVTTGDWEGAYKNLMHFTDPKTPTGEPNPLFARAQRDAKLLRAAIDAGMLPD